MNIEERTKLEERLKELDGRLSEKNLILLRGIDADLACLIRHDKREIEDEMAEINKKLQ
jgi:hypothetical protein